VALRGGFPLVASPEIETDEEQGLRHDESAHYCGDDAGRGLGAAHRVVDPVPDRHQQDAAAAAVVQPGQHDRTTAQADDEADIIGDPQRPVGRDDEEQGQVPQCP
jgi:hypothetical protein